MKRMLVAVFLLGSLELSSAVAAVQQVPDVEVVSGVSVHDLSVLSPGVPDDVQIVARGIADAYSMPVVHVEHGARQASGAVAAEASSLESRFAIRERTPIWPSAAVLALCVLAGITWRSRGRPPSWRFA